MANTIATLAGSSLFSGNGGLLPTNTGGAILFPSPLTKFRESVNEIEGKTWFELDVSDADTIVIIQDGKKVKMDKKDFLQKIGLEW